MTNKEAHKLLFANSYFYEESSDSIYHYPCDDLHGTFSGNDCNCTRQITRKYLSQGKIDERVSEYLQAQELNKGLYAVSVKMSGHINVSPCKSEKPEKQNTPFHWGSDNDFSMYCEKNQIEEAKKHLISLCLAEYDKKINKAKKDKEYFLESAAKNSATSNLA